MSNARVAARVLVVGASVMMVVGVVGFVVALALNVFLLDKYNAYGEVPIPGSGSLHLPAGEATVSLHTVVISGPSGGGLPVPPLGMTIIPPTGVPDPAVTESIGSTTTVNNDSHVRVWRVQVPADGTYTIKTDGQVGGFINPRLAFGHQSSYGYLVWVFVGLFVVGLIDLVVSVRWIARVRRKAASVPDEPPGAASEPADEGVRLERLKTLAALRDSGALTDTEFETEKRRILDGG